MSTPVVFLERQNSLPRIKTSIHGGAESIPLLPRTPSRGGHGKNTVTKFIACKGKVKALMALGQSHFYLQDHTTMLLTESTWVDAWTVKEASDIMSNAAYLNKRMQSLKNFVKYFYDTCASLISQHSDDGSMTKYWWDIPEHANER